MYQSFHSLKTWHRLFSAILWVELALALFLGAYNLENLVRILFVYCTLAVGLSKLRSWLAHERAVPLSQGGLQAVSSMNSRE